MMSEQDRRGALEAVERIVNRGGEHVVAETLAVLRKAYPAIELGDGRFHFALETPQDRELLDRAGVLVSQFLSPETRSVSGDT